MTHFSITNIAESSTVLTMIALAVILIYVPKPHGNDWKSFRHALNYLLVAFLVLALGNIPTALVPHGISPLHSAIVICIGSLQALLFTAVTIVMISPRSGFIRRIPFQVTGIGLLSVILIASTQMLSNPLSRWVFHGFVIAYLIQCGIYTHIFWRIYQKTIARLEDYYDDDMHNRIRWMRKMFFIALFIGLLAIVAAYHFNFYPLFSIIVAIFYAYLLSCMIRYMFTAGYLLQAIRPRQSKTADTTEASTVLSNRERQLEERLAQWVEAKEYTKTDIGIDEIAQQLGTSYTSLNHYFANVLHTTFRNWRTELRIAESKRIMQQQPDISAREAGNLAGFNDRANFYRYFQRSEGMTPAEYRDSLH